MKKNQYSVSIVIGLLMGAAVALSIDNMTTATLVGVIASSITAWVGSLQRGGEARKFATGIAKKVRVVEVMDVFIFTKNMMWGIKTYISQLIIRTLLAIRRMVVILATNVEARKAILAIFTVISIIVLNFMVISSLSMNIAFFPVIIQVVYAFYAFCAFVVTIQAFYALVFIVVTVITSKALKESGPFLLSDDIKKWNPDNIWLNWFSQMILDDRGALTATVYMLYIRTGNALRIIAYPLILMPWGFIALANNKTGIAALSVMVLSGAHLSIAYFVGGIDDGNINFWLSLAVAMMAGVAIGKKIGEMREESLEIPPLPAIRFRHQVEQVAG